MAAPVDQAYVEDARIDLRRLSPADAVRLGEIVWVLARHGVLVAGRRGPSLVVEPRAATPKAVAVALRRSFIDLGPTFVKLGQLIASSPGLFPDALSQEFRSLLDRVPPEPSETVRRVVATELGAPLEELFADFDDDPIAAASVAQVHRARLHDGRSVAVKVRRPRLRRRFEIDLRLLRLLAAALQHAGALGETLNPVAVVEDFATTLRAEIDFRNEAGWMAEFARNLRAFGENDKVVVPEAIEEMVTPRLLVMTRIEGTPIDDVTALREAGHDVEELLRCGVRAWMEACLEHGLFHGDVHAGNLFVTADGRLVFLDFGIMGRLTDGTRRVLRAALPALLIEREYERVVRAFFELGATTGPVNIEQAALDVRVLVEPLLEKALAEIAFGEILRHVLSVATRHHVRLPRELVLVVKQLLYFERYAKELAPNYRPLADSRIVTHLLGDRRPSPPRRAPIALAEAEPPRLRDDGLVVPGAWDTRFTWHYEPQPENLAKLYEKAKRSQWNAALDVDWSTDVDPLDTGGLADYLPLVAAESFERMNEKERREAAHHFNSWLTSQFLHGEQGALLATSKLVLQVPDHQAKLYGATQVVDEARHVEVYARYLREKLELTYPINANLAQLLEMIVSDSRWDVTFLGMQVIVEGLALAAFGLIHQFSSEPLIKSITRYVMADEARHVAFGSLALSGIYDEMSDADRRDREDFIMEAAWLMRDRFLAAEVWERLGIPASDGLRDSAQSPMLQVFQRVLFAKITPNLAKLGLLTDHLRDGLVSVGAIAHDGL